MLPKVQRFYLRGFDETGMLYDEVGYKKDVLSSDKRPFRASLLWLVHGGAITLAQADRLDEIYQHRHQLTHELGNYILDPDLDPDMYLFVDAVKILRDISDFWTQIEIDIGTFEAAGAVSVDDVMPGPLMVLEMCVDAYVQGLSDAAE